MNTIMLTQKQLNNLLPYYVEKEVRNSEAQIFMLNQGNWKFKDELLLKKLFITNNEAMASKLFTVSLLSDKEEEIGIEELVIPKHLVAVKSRKQNPIVGITVPKIEHSKNLGIILNNPKVNNEEKLELLYYVGKLIKKTQSLKKKGINFSFGDLHEYNFLVTEDNKLKAVDLDSAYLGTNYPMPSYYLVSNKNLDEIKGKYRKNKDGIVYPNKNTDLLCYDFMLLNTISRGQIHKLGISDYYDYLSYLKYLGYGKDIIKCFEVIYTSSSNINPINFLDQIPEDKIGESGIKIYQLKKDRKII